MSHEANKLCRLLQDIQDSCEIRIFGRAVLRDNAVFPDKGVMVDWSGKMLESDGSGIPLTGYRIFYETLIIEGAGDAPLSSKND